MTKHRAGGPAPRSPSAASSRPGETTARSRAAERSIQRAIEHVEQLPRAGSTRDWGVAGTPSDEAVGAHERRPIRLDTERGVPAATDLVHVPADAERFEG